MKKIVLFSQPVNTVMAQIVEHIFPPNLKDKRIAYINPEGKGEKYNVRKAGFTKIWNDLADQNDTEFIHIDICNNSKAEKERLNECNIILVSGGNSFLLLKHLKENDFLEIIRNKLMTTDTIYAGFSAGACLLTPTMAIADEEPFNENEEINLKDVSALNLVSFEIFPHYADKYSKVIEIYQRKTSNKIITLTDEEYIVIG